MRNNKLHLQWFTLVELIVVITILAILWTVAFLSLQNYSTLARNSIRLDWVSKVATIVQTKKQVWMNILSFADTGQEVSWAQISGTTADIWVDYQAWTINTSALWVKTEDFSDPLNWQLFRMLVTKKKWGQYQVVATLEEGSTTTSKYELS